MLGEENAHLATHGTDVIQRTFLEQLFSGMNRSGACTRCCEHPSH